MNDIDWLDIESTLAIVVNQFIGLLAEADIADIRVSITAGESGLALETLCTQLYEYDVPVTPAVIADLDRVGRIMHLDPSLWRDLKLVGE